MPNHSSQPTVPAEAIAGEAGMTEVLARSMLGTATAIHGAVARSMAIEPIDDRRESLLGLAMNRLEFLTAQLRALADGVPSTLVPAVDPARQHGDSLIEDGTAIELYSAFDRTWSAGFEIASAAEVGYRVRRHSDGSLLPGYTSRTDLRALDTRERR